MGSGWVVLIVVVILLVGLFAFSGCAWVKSIFGSTPEQQAANEATAAQVGGSLAVNVLFDNVPAANQAQVAQLLDTELMQVAAALTQGNLNIGKIIAPFNSQIAALVPGQYANVITVGLTALAAVDVSTAAIPPQYVTLLQAFIAGARSAIPATPAPKVMRDRGADIQVWQNWLVSQKK
jgi:hypothetical protein